MVWSRKKQSLIYANALAGLLLLSCYSGLCGRQTTCEQNVEPYMDVCNITHVVELNGLQDKLLQNGDYDAVSGSPMVTLQDGTIIAVVYGGTDQGLDLMEKDIYLCRSIDDGITWSIPVGFIDGVMGFRDDASLSCVMSKVMVYPSLIYRDSFSLSMNMTLKERLWCLVNLDITVDSPEYFNTFIYGIYSDDGGYTWVGVRDCWLYPDDCVNVSAQTGLQDRFSSRRCGCWAGPGQTIGDRILFPGFGGDYLMWSGFFGFLVYCDDPGLGLYSHWMVSDAIGPQYVIEGKHVSPSEWSFVMLSNGSAYCTFRAFIGLFPNPPDNGYRCRLKGWMNNTSSGVPSVPVSLSVAFNESSGGGNVLSWDGDALLTYYDEGYRMRLSCDCLGWSDAVSVDGGVVMGVSSCSGLMLLGFYPFGSDSLCVLRFNKECFMFKSEVNEVKKCP